MFSLLCLLALSAPQPNILFLTADTLRTDRLGYHGAAPSPTPHLDRRAASGMRFLDALCEEPQTGPSFCAMFTGRVPRTTGVIRNSVPLAPEVPVVTEALREAGYATAAVVGNWNLKRKLSGLDRGFDHYYDDFGKDLFGRARTERRAEDTTDKALAWLRERPRDQPFFFWVHYMDPHAPYRLNGRFTGARTPLRDMPIRDQVRLRYDSEVAYMDHHIGRLLAALPEENTFIVFAADHGESLLEHNYLGHTRKLYRNIIHIPLFIQGPGVAAGETRLPARGIDLAPTLLGLAGIAPSAGMDGLDLLRTPPPADRVRVVETYGGAIPVSEQEMDALTGRPPRLQAVREGDWKLITGDGGVQLYDVRKDPEERRNVAEQERDVVARLQQRIQDWDSVTPRHTARPATLTREDRRALDAAGYL